MIERSEDLSDYKIQNTYIKDIILEKYFYNPKEDSQKLLTYFSQEPSNVRRLQALDLAKGLLQINPLKRLSAEEALRHPFFNEYEGDCKESVMQGIKKIEITPRSSQAGVTGKLQEVQNFQTSE